LTVLSAREAQVDDRADAGLCDRLTMGNGIVCLADPSGRAYAPNHSWSVLTGVTDGEGNQP
jgi:hypothetical protein